MLERYTHCCIHQSSTSFISCSFWGSNRWRSLLHFLTRPSKQRLLTGSKGSGATTNSAMLGSLNSINYIIITLPPTSASDDSQQYSSHTVSALLSVFRIRKRLYMLNLLLSQGDDFVCLRRSWNRWAPVYITHDMSIVSDLAETITNRRIAYNY